MQQLMNPDIVKQMINEYNAEIEKCLSEHPDTFVYDKRIYQLYTKISHIQEMCPHKFTDGVCEFCGQEQNTK